MGRSKKAVKKKHGKDEHPSSSVKGEQEQSYAFKSVFIKCIVDFYEAETTMSLHNKYVKSAQRNSRTCGNGSWMR